MAKIKKGVIFAGEILRKKSCYLRPTVFVWIGYVNAGTVGQVVTSQPVEDAHLQRSV